MSKADQLARVIEAAREDNPALTVEAARRFLALEPKSHIVLELLANALVQLAQFADAETAYTKALLDCPAKARVRIHRSLGLLKSATGEHQQAVAAFREAITSAPNDASAYIYLGGMYAEQGALNEAEHWHRTATGCSAGCIDEAWLNLGLVLRAQRRYHEAAAAFKTALTLTPEYPDASLALADVTAVLAGRAEA